ncbi:uncharacterized protein BDR25DRAFT_117725 [Lindgomyces ingoldianus]|uniref:Uncharacterized protein n=1 Tax=Lindgomyces ingoldianus TaxID=673940 RepID=A0ACB6Q7U7_9PLEO|nr:uncharacterized protein BDR25DRAFT_117725 [Lindgomyces ingoldianus]KAF2462931.1 hypothetical protein BDR25DRAFT_117725 [Lindgomyces ingoldianus]
MHFEVRRLQLSGWTCTSASLTSVLYRNVSSSGVVYETGLRWGSAGASDCRLLALSLAVENIGTY